MTRLFGCHGCHLFGQLQAFHKHLIPGQRLLQLRNRLLQAVERPLAQLPHDALPRRLVVLSEVGQDQLLARVLWLFGLAQVLPVVVPDPDEGLSGGGPQLGQRRQLLVRGLMPKLNKGGRQANVLGDGVHALLAQLVLMAVQQAGDEADGISISVFFLAGTDIAHTPRACVCVCV